MAKTDVTQWDTSAANNTDVSGVSIAEGCPAGGINDAIRALMAQVAAWIVSATGPVLQVAGLIPNTIQVADGTGAGRGIGYRNLPFTAATTGRTLALTDVGMSIPSTGTVTVPPNSSTAFAVGDMIAIYNSSSSNITIAQGSGVTIRLGGSAITGDRVLAQRGLGVLLKVDINEWVALNGGVS